MSQKRKQKTKSEVLHSFIHRFYFLEQF
jgi:hypothetical protein